MADPHRVALIRGEPLFAPLSLATVEHLASCLQPVHLDDGDYLIRQGERGRSFFLIDEGRAEVTRDGRAVRVVGPGAGLGEIALLDDVPRTASVKAIGPLQALSVERDEFLEAVTGHVVSRSLARERTVDLRAADAEGVALH
jgi:CRP-like cAMP-binding protein